ncbi:S53 family peptidase [Lacisediminihabitans profunda]|uniref:S8/S53 family peptidase n=1 Tax=Lacisediminihabitans profunda TaxID=2594790 RepID=A0A5C8UTL4_9MICO|nr:S53 family peptidase [Lacisediminihabitans profunda]TXN31980.1 S8/S53 family peptidase [Lacisediminihabitans profunda]
MDQDNEPVQPAVRPPAAPSDAGLELRPLPGSERAPARGVVPAAAELSSEGTIEATVMLRRRRAVDAETVLAAAPMSREVLAESMGADPRDVELVASTLESLGVTVVSTDLASRRVRISGTVATMGRVFGVQLHAVTSLAADGSPTSHRHRTGGLMVPAALDGVVTAVLGLDDRPQARAEFRVAEARAVSVSYTPIELGQIYRFPPGTDGSGQSIAIIELGGGFAQAELSTYFTSLGITGPTVTAVGVDGAKNQPGKDPAGADGEVLLDIEVAGALSPGSAMVVYFAPNTDAGFVDAVSEAAHAATTPTSMSISWGQNEDAWTEQARRALDDAFLDAAALGITVTAAAGDNGSSDGANDDRDHADFPASSPHVLACGGTSLRASAGTVRSETVWNNGAGGGATGGGVSDVFTLPAWQQRVGVPPSGTQTGGRGVPDVAAVADPNTGYAVLVDGEHKVYGGTSAVAPLWAALVARLAQATGRPLGLLQPTLYRAAGTGEGEAGFRDVISGNNGSFSAKPGWDACTGLGVPDGVALLALLEAQPAR